MKGKAGLKVADSNQFKIEKGVPINRRPRGEILYPFADMLKGDSFLVPAADEAEYKRTSNSLHRQARMFAKQFGDYIFTVRRVDGGVRCWRLK